MKSKFAESVSSVATPGAFDTTAAIATVLKGTPVFDFIEI